ncbi:MAG: hypothetical protein K9N46_08525 [Candidatus Marinimicrobia bacterium]|nr:hypothetical protein [Candidatus Neomarinimicrobiota bacterium]MCF7828852.1 hypothetical protein [Candidatus Neomarinimicrobiota bacterium]MCF7880769.1 hypothetical protein [Candidatus Neomarinimicrobiota bacterium]
MGLYLRRIGLVCLFLMGTLAEGAFERQRAPVLPWNNPALGVAGVIEDNPAQLGMLNSPLVAASYTNLFGIRALQMGRSAFVFPTSLGVIGGGTSIFGNTGYSEQRYAVAFSRTVTEEGTIGLSVNGYQLSVPKYGNAGAFSIDIGTAWRVSDQVRWELGYSNLSRASIGKGAEPIPQQIFSAFRYSLPETFSAQISLRHDLRYPVRLGIGFGYVPVPWIEAAAQFLTEPSRFQMGVNLHWKWIHVQYVLETHQTLPLTHRFGLVLDF